MTDKEQIMIDTNKYFLEVIDDGGGTIGYTVVHPERLLRDIIKQNKQLASKTQECEIWKNQVLILDDTNFTVQITQEQFEEYQKLKQECEELREALKEEVIYKRTYLKSLLDCKEERKEQEDKIKKLRKNLALEIELTARYRKALEEIEEYIKEEEWSLLDYVVRDINDIINKAKE